MKLTFVISGILTSLLLAACAMDKPEIDQVAQAKMIGLSKKKIVACMGAPAKRRAVGSTEIWSYPAGHVRMEGQGFATIGHARHDACDVNIIMTNGVVSQINYSGVAGDPLDAGERCLFAVQQCVPQ